MKAKCNKHRKTGTDVKAECQQACPCITELTDDPNLTKINRELRSESSLEEQKSESDLEGQKSLREQWSGSPLKKPKSGSPLDTLQVKKSQFRKSETREEDSDLEI